MTDLRRLLSPISSVASPIKGTYVAVGFPLAAIVVALLTHASRLGLSWPLLLCFIVAAALGERVTVRVTARHHLSIVGQFVMVAALLGGPLVGGIVGLATQLASGDTIWRRRSTDAGLSALQGLCVGLLAPLPAHDAGKQIVLVAAACCISHALNMVTQALIGLEREVRPWPAHVRLVVKADAASAVASFVFVLLLAPVATQEPTVMIAGLAGALAFYALLRHFYLQHRQALSAEQSLARHDAITGAPNLLALDEELALAHRRVLHGERPAGLYVLDLDHFKRVNGAYRRHLWPKPNRTVAVRLPTLKIKGIQAEGERRRKPPAKACPTFADVLQAWIRSERTGPMPLPQVMAARLRHLLGTVTVTKRPVARMTSPCLCQ